MANGCGCGFVLDLVIGILRDHGRCSVRGVLVAVTSNRIGRSRAHIFDHTDRARLGIAGIQNTLGRSFCYAQVLAQGFWKCL
jgi:hypothetical protein